MSVCEKLNKIKYLSSLNRKLRLCDILVAINKAIYFREKNMKVVKKMKRKLSEMIVESL